MIYLFTGNNIEKARAKAFEWIAAARAKAPEVSYIRLSGAEITQEALTSVAQTQGLFFTKTLALLDDPFSEGAAGDCVLADLNTLSASENPIAILAPKLSTPRFKKIEAQAKKIFSFDIKEKETRRGFNGALVGALGFKNGPALWKEIVIALRHGDAPEALHGLLHWKARDMMARGNSVWGKDGARKLSRDLIELLSDSRSGELPLKESLERFALSMS